MNAFPFRHDKKMTEVFAQGGFTHSAEIIPPRNGTEQLKVLQQISKLTEAGAQFLAVTKGAGGSLRGGSLPIAQTIKEQFGVPCIAHFTCRDLVPVDVENQLMDHHYFGIRNILAVRGDPPVGQPNWQAREGGYNYAYELIAQIRKLNTGEYLLRDSGPEIAEQVRTDFCIGAAAYPEHSNPVERLNYFKLKVEAGAEFGITDMLYCSESYGRFIDEISKANCSIPILPATRILKSRAEAERMMTRFPNIKIPASFLNQLGEPDDPDGVQKGIDLFLDLTERLKKYGAPGIHIYVIGNTGGACSALQKLTRKVVSVA